MTDNIPQFLSKFWMNIYWDIQAGSRKIALPEAGLKSILQSGDI